eukprot:CAMPEP_0169199146 /NCGR_PEP_ID=MMETSP1016-20121227/9187_1 /TAXON_ID=342587 /ORGANISM="Karlodinium micrum, Strain CCMP2283" /LENGTH=330 /DNA_ID=CAMNT_0009275923 /DNA_START=88 /DNA_END=1080 /DNA_ORIENTATION=+
MEHGPSKGKERRCFTWGCAYIGIGVVVGFAACFVAALVCRMIYRETQLDLHWSRGPWVGHTCRVVESALAYRGNCNLKPEAAVHYRDCITEAERFNVTLGGTHDNCNTRAEAAYQAEAAGKVDLADLLVEGRRLRAHKWHVYGGEPCYDAYLVWSLVQVVNDNSAVNATSSYPTFCAYTYGAEAPSVTDDWVDAAGLVHRQRLARSKNVLESCWSFFNDECIIALRHPKAMTARLMADAMQVRILAFALSLVILIGLAGFVVHFRRKCFGAGFQYQSLPSEEASEVANDHAKRVVETAFDFGESSTPPPSPKSIMRSKFDGSRNLANDFL